MSSTAEPLQPQTGLVEVLVPRASTEPASSDPDPEGDWLCALCLTPVANERDRFSFNGQDQFTFTNPAGFRFDIITFAQTRACRETGVPTLNDTWFPGHAWSFCQCAECGQHLGWFYSGEHKFAGLITDRIVRALLIRN